jgi:tetratricopeptide (TPR) repeat protein
VQWLVPFLIVSAAWADEASLAALAARARSALQNGDYAAAERSYRQVVALAPEMAEAYTNLGLSCHLQKKYDEAIKAFDQGLRINPDMTNAWLFLGIAHFNLHRPSHALKALNRYMQMRPGDVQGHYYAGLSLLSLDREPEAVSEFNEALRLDPANVDAMYHLAQSYLRMAETHLRERGETGPDAAAMRVFEKGFESAVEKIVAVDPQSFRVRQLRAGYYQATGDTRRALQELKTLLATSPNVSGLNYTLGCAYLQDRAYDEAIAAFEAELRCDSPFPRTYLQLGHAWIGKGDSARALPFLLRATREEPESGVPWVEVGRAQTRLGQLEEAIASFNKAIELREAKASVYYLLCMACKKAGKVEAARAAFQKSQELSRKEHERVVTNVP